VVKGLECMMFENRELCLLSLQRRRLKEKSNRHAPLSDEGLKRQWGQALFRGKEQKEKKQLQAAAREIPASSKEEILHGVAGMAAQRSSGVPSLGGI